MPQNLSVEECKTCIITGKALSQDHGGSNRREKREIPIMTDEGTIERISFFDNYIDAGEEVTIVYLPHSKFGTRIK